MGSMHFGWLVWPCPEAQLVPVAFWGTVQSFLRNHIYQTAGSWGLASHHGHPQAQAAMAPKPPWTKPACSLSQALDQERHCESPSLGLPVPSSIFFITTCSIPHAFILQREEIFFSYSCTSFVLAQMLWTSWSYKMIMTFRNLTSITTH